MKSKYWLGIEFGPNDNTGADKMVKRLDGHALEVKKHEQFGMTVDESGRKTGNLPWRIVVRATFATREQAEEVRRTIWPT